MKVLVAIANYGQGNQQYLWRLIETYSRMPVFVHLVVLSDVAKDFGKDVEVLVGLPTSNSWSLPFAHRAVFIQRLNDYDIFIYSEDDTLMEWKTLSAWLEASRTLHENEISGFLRTEEDLDGRVFFSSCHSHFRWHPSSIRVRNGNLWAYYTNEHSACFVVSQPQLQRALNSGGFGTTPHEGRFDMLCSAATDIYTRCGMERLLCIDRIHDFALPHLPNKYTSRMGLPAVEMEWQLDALRKIHAGELPKEEMINPETKFPFGFGSKRLREDPDFILNDIIADAKGFILVWGSGDGKAEEGLRRSDRHVGVVAVNSVMAECCRKRGLTVLGAGSAPTSNPEKSADVLVMADILHLAKDPAKMLEESREWIKSSGRLVIRVPNFRDFRMIRRRFGRSGYRLPLTREATGVTAFTMDQLAELLHLTGFRDIKIKSPVLRRFQIANKLTFGLLSKRLSPHWYIVARKG